MAMYDLSCSSSASSLLGREGTMSAHSFCSLSLGFGLLMMAFSAAFLSGGRLVSFSSTSMVMVPFDA